MNSSSLLFATIEQGLLFLPLALGIFIAFRILRITDLTVDGSFILGASVFAVIVSNRSGALSFGMILVTLLATFLGLFSGVLAGVFTAVISRKIPSLLAGILTLFILQSLNLIVMGRPSIALPHQGLPPLSISALLGYNAVLIFALLAIFQSRLGLILRCYGDNPALLKRRGYSLLLIRAAGLGLSNFLVSFSGILNACACGYADIQMGQGVVLIGIGTIVLGRQVLMPVVEKKCFSRTLEICACLVGVALYFFVLHLLLSLGVPFLFLKMLIGLLLILVIFQSYEPGRSCFDAK